MIVAFRVALSPCGLGGCRVGPEMSSECWEVLGGQACPCALGKGGYRARVACGRGRRSAGDRQTLPVSVVIRSIVGLAARPCAFGIWRRRCRFPICMVFITAEVVLKQILRMQRRDAHDAGMPSCILTAAKFEG